MKTNKLEPCVSDNDRQKRKRPKTNCTCFQKLSLKKKNVVYRSSRPEVFCKKGVLRNFTTFTGKRLCQRLFFNKVVGPRLATLLKKSLWHKGFPVNFAKFLRTPPVAASEFNLSLHSLKILWDVLKSFLSKWWNTI